MLARSIPITRPLIGIKPLRASFHSLVPLQSIYNTNKKVSPKTPPKPVTTTTTTTTTPPPTTTGKSSTGKFQDQVKKAQENLLTNKYYQRTPNFLKPYIAGFLTRPVGFGISFFILHEITAVIPLLTLWWVFIKFNWIPVDLPTEFILKGTDIITSKLMDVPDSKLIYDKASIIIAGANAYAATKLLMPFRLPLSILLTPWFDRVVVQRIKKLFTRNKKKT